MSEYRFHLEKYAGRSSRHTCPKCGRPQCFARYVDEEGSVVFPDEVGRCDHASECGYHYKPSQFFFDNPTESFSFENPSTSTPRPAAPRPPLATLDMQACECCQPYFKDTPLATYLEQLFTRGRVQAVVDLYKVGGYTDGRVVFPFIDESGRLTTGKVMRYDCNGHRGHADEDTTYIHSLIRKWEYDNRTKSPLILRQSDEWKFSTRQCWFGAHLLPSYPDNVVAIVESEKTALFCSCVQPSFVWLATSSMNCFRANRAPNLKGRSVLVYPDANAVGEWNRQLPTIECKAIKSVPWYALEESGSKRDIADLIEDVLLAFQRGDDSDLAKAKAALLAESMRADFSFESPHTCPSTSCSSSPSTPTSSTAAPSSASLLEVSSTSSSTPSTAPPTSASSSGSCNNCISSPSILPPTSAPSPKSCIERTAFKLSTPTADIDLDLDAIGIPFRSSFPTALTPPKYLCEDISTPTREGVGYYIMQACESGMFADVEVKHRLTNIGSVSHITATATIDGAPLRFEVWTLDNHPVRRAHCWKQVGGEWYTIRRDWYNPAGMLFRSQSFFFENDIVREHQSSLPRNIESLNLKQKTA